MGRVKKHSSLLAKYTLMYEKKPRSRVFAPLAESYRKIGMIDDSLQILKEGIKHHPTYTLGYIVLANCYYDMQNYEMAYSTIRPFIAKNLENITLQKLFAKTCLNISHLEEALETFTYLLLLNPKDNYVADQIKILEDDLLVNSDTDVVEYDDSAEGEFNEDDWVEVSFNKKHKEIDEKLDQWNLEKESPLDKFKNDIENKELEVTKHNLDDQYYHEDYDNDADDVISFDKHRVVKDKEKPIITHTLVDLYCKQGHIDKAIEILENILEIHPNDKVTKYKLENLQASQNSEIEISDEIIQDDKLKNLEIVFSKFQAGLNSKSNEVLTK